MARRFFDRLLGRARPTLAPEAHQREYRACDAALSTARPISPLVREMMALYCHTRTIGALSQDEDYCDEYRMTARSIIHHILEGWQNQTDGRGTIDDPLLQPRSPHLFAGHNAAHVQPGVEQYCRATHW
ncbi:hypothetical protein ACFU98_32365 [Streptomyces sp. NPDC057575]|uniref:hypothetical protein n=1 Tax=unclassified Streptomyces TaxID=2593676 RepID=UPI0036769C84